MKKVIPLITRKLKDEPKLGMFERKLLESAGLDRQPEGAEERTAKMIGLDKKSLKNE
jgi:hypothetical protein